MRVKLEQKSPIKMRMNTTIFVQPGADANLRYGNPLTTQPARAMEANIIPKSSAGGSNRKNQFVSTPQIQKRPIKAAIAITTMDLTTPNSCPLNSF
jgi:hypothetical protein